MAGCLKKKKQVGSVEGRCGEPNPLLSTRRVVNLVWQREAMEFDTWQTLFLSLINLF